MTLEPNTFRDEAVRYATGLWRAGISADLRVHAGYPHAFDVLLIGSSDEQRHRDERVRVLQGF